ncbi:hypothetical protein BYT27DRAFT_7116722 [Phlegmacium glaucopus]|nr:hypothetical protein BYT27DRAFT_7116722 [Phlegmacium glaucopus]
MAQAVNNRRHRRDCKYTAEERKVMELHKETFRTQTTKPGHLHILRTKILPDIFNYWEGTGNTPKMKRRVVSASRQDLSAWLSNNWRPRHMLARKMPTNKIKRSELIWKTRGADIFKEITIILGIENPNTTTPGWFGARLPAIARILE